MKILSTMMAVAFPLPALLGPEQQASVPTHTAPEDIEKLTQAYRRLHEDGDNETAASLAKQACTLLEREKGRRSTQLASCLNDLGLFQKTRLSHQEAEAAYKKSLSIREDILGRNHPEVAEILNNLAVLYLENRDYDAAMPLFQRALSINEKKLGPDHINVAMVLDGIAALHEAKGEFGQATLLLEREILIIKSIPEARDMELPRPLTRLGLLNEKRGMYDVAEPLLEEALFIRRTTLGHEHPTVADSMTTLAKLRIRQGRHGDARTLLEEALSIHEAAFGSEHPDVATVLNNLGVLFLEQEDHRSSRRMLRRALAIREKALGPDHPLVAQTLDNLSSTYSQQGAFDEAQPFLEQALSIRQKSLAPNHPDIALNLNNLALLYIGRGEYDSAEAPLQRAILIRQKAFGDDHPDVAQSLNNLATIQSKRGNQAEARKTLERVLAIYEATLPPGHPYIGRTLNNLGTVIMEEGDLLQAESLFRRALKLQENAMGMDSLSVAHSLGNLAFLSWRSGRPSEAKDLAERARSIREGALGQNHIDLANILLLLASINRDLGEHDLSLELHQRALRVEEENLALAFAVGDETRRLSYALLLANATDYTLSLHLQKALSDEALGELALTTLLRRKEQVQDLAAQSYENLRRSVPHRHRHLFDDLAESRRQQAALIDRLHGPLSSAERSDVLVELKAQEKQQDEAWSGLAKSSPAVRASPITVNASDIMQIIPRSGALVEFVRYRPRHDSVGHYSRNLENLRYAVYLVFNDHFDWVDLGPAAPIDEHVRAFRKALQTKQGIPSDLYNSVMGPIVEKLGPARRLVIAPAGALSLVPFGALHDGNRYLIEKYEIRYVTTGRDLLAPPPSTPVTTAPVTVVANPAGAFLPDAELEADFLEGFFPNTRVLRGEQATETDVCNIERPLILHMATHGFFGEARSERDNPMLRSGLYLANIEQVEVDREHDDGQLTAYEVSGMDLRGTQLVVLSACDTGMGADIMAEGKVLMSEGVSGLRRAFAVAGARTTVMSLWPVSGVTAQATMEAYYRKLAEGLGPGTAMQAVQLEMLRTKEHAHPKDWAVFIVSGDDDPLKFPAGQEPKLVELPLLEQGPPPVHGRLGCTVAASSSDRDFPPPGLVLGLAGLVVLRRRRPPSLGAADSRKPDRDRVRMR